MPVGAGGVAVKPAGRQFSGTLALKPCPRLPFNTIGMASDFRPTVPAPRSTFSVAPILSIFTLRPKAHTVKPPEDTARTSPTRRRTRVALWGLAAVLTGTTAFGAWHFAKAPKRARHEAPAVYVNGAPKEKHSAHGKVQRWGAGGLTLKVDASVESLGPGAVAAVQSGFGAWIASDATLPSLTFDTTSGMTPKLAPDGVNAVMVAPIEIAGHRHDLALTVTFVDEGTGRIIESDVIINSKMDHAVLAGVEGCDGKYDLQSVVAHEAGHFFGLGEDEEDQSTTMFYKTAKCDLGKRDLEVPDRTVMAGLYLQPAPEGEADGDTGGGCGGATIAGRGSPGPFGVAGVVIAALISLRRRRAG